MFKIVGITFSSDLRKPCWITGESLSPKSKKCPVLENNHIYQWHCCERQKNNNTCGNIIKDTKTAAPDPDGNIDNMTAGI